MSLENKVCIVTGGGSGIGRATALLMAKHGAKMVIIGRTKTKVVAVCNEIEQQGETAHPICLNVGDHAAVHRMAKTVLEKFGTVDILVNNAGHSSPNRMLQNTTRY